MVNINYLQHHEAHMSQYKFFYLLVVNVIYPSAFWWQSLAVAHPLYTQISVSSNDNNGDILS